MSPMTATVARARALASRMIAREGGLCVLKRVTQGAHDPINQVRAPDVVQQLAVRAVAIPYTPLVGTGLGLSMQQQEAMLADGYVFKIAAAGLPFEPRPGDDIVDAANVTRAVVTVVRVAPDGNPVAYTVAAAR